MLMYEAQYLDQLLGVAKEQGIICIADEVMTGFGRTGKKFAIDYLLHQPDIICLSKGITGGFLPLGATVCTQQIFDAFYSTDRTKTFFHGHSYTANPLACAAANASMDLLSTSACKQQIADISSSHRAFAAEIKGHGFVKEVRQQGTILAMELGRENNSSYFSQIRDKAYEYYLSRGVFLRPLGNTVYIMPPYCVTTQELDRIYAAIRDSLQFLSVN
jgi:adenosylmethionine---8-amino-7-oxononanoate aminotransferase